MALSTYQRIPWPQNLQVLYEDAQMLFNVVSAQSELLLTACPLHLMAVLRRLNCSYVGVSFQTFDVSEE